VHFIYSVSRLTFIPGAAPHGVADVTAVRLFEEAPPLLFVELRLKMNVEDEMHSPGRVPVIFVAHGDLLPRALCPPSPSCRPRASWYRVEGRGHLSAEAYPGVGAALLHTSGNDLDAVESTLNFLPSTWIIFTGMEFPTV
jgi:hypothetical protein